MWAVGTNFVSFHVFTIQAVLTDKGLESDRLAVSPGGLLAP
jgi:hypothetical protein